MNSKRATYKGGSFLNKFIYESPIHIQTIGIYILIKRRLIMIITDITKIGDPQIILYEGKYYCYATSMAGIQEATLKIKEFVQELRI